MPAAVENFGKAVDIPADQTRVGRLAVPVVAADTSLEGAALPVLEGSW